MNRAHVLVPVLFAALSGGPALAGDHGITGPDVQAAQNPSTDTVQLAQAMSSDDFVEILKPDTRGLGIIPSVDMQVRFAYNSAVLSEEARILLRELGTALVSDDLGPYRFEIAGHTDATGTEVYNVGLSERRASAVRNYLTGNFAIGPDRLQSVGLGETNLLLPDDPTAAANRRVQISNIGSGG